MLCSDLLLTLYMIPFNRNVNKVDVTLHFEGPCAVIPAPNVSPDCGGRPNGVGTTDVGSIG